VGDLEEDTAVEGADGEWTARLSADWEIWGPNGGYLAAVALRVAGAHSGLQRPASLACQYLGGARFEALRLTTRTLRASRRAESVEVIATQGGRTVLAALVWVVADDLAGLTCDAGPPPEVPSPDALKSTDELLSEEERESGFSFWANLEHRPTSWIPPESRAQLRAGAPELTSWLRFRPTATFADPFVDAGRLIILLDTLPWPAATRAHAFDQLTHVAPSLDVGVAIHRLEPSSEWLLVRATSPAAADGLVGGLAQVWSRSGTLLASATQQMLCRPVAHPADNR
jgi:acyl-CoA thioesterase